MANRNNHNVKVTESVYKAVKTLIAGGASIKECSEYMHLSSQTVSIIKNSETYEEYKHKIYVTSGGYRKKMEAAEKAKKEAEAKELPAQKLIYDKPTATEKQTTVVVQATHYMMEELKQMNETLKCISNKLAFIVDELTR